MKRINHILITAMVLVAVAMFANADIPPAPVGLDNDTGNYWVNYTWSKELECPDNDNVTDSFNVRTNGAWYNGTATFLNKSVGAGNWSNITVWAYNRTGNGNMSAVDNVSDNVQAPAMVDPPDDNPCTIMHPDSETRRKWIESYNAAPRVNISREGVRALPDAYSVLGRLDYNATERNQGSCGNCWVWAATGCMEVAHDAENDVFDRLSVQYLNSLYYDGTGDDYACEGGNLDEFVDFYSVNTTFAIPWNNTNASWQDGGGGTSTAVPADSISTTPHYTITRINETTITTQGVENATAIANIKGVLTSDSAIWFAFYLPTGADWDNFRGFWNTGSETDLWSPDYSCGHTWEEPGGGGHAVLCVGYNDTNGPETEPYWIMLNSWGTANGNRSNGLFRMNMDINYSCNFVDDGSEYSLYWQMLDIDFAVPTPTNLQSTTGNYWVNYTWTAGTGIVTDGYNVSMNGAWHNRTETFLNSSVGAGNWSNITVWAWNATGNGNMSEDNISDNVQAPAATGDVTVTATSYTAINSTDNTTLGAALTFQFNTTNTTGQLVPHYINASNMTVCVNGVPGGFGTITGNGTFTLNSSYPTDYVSVTVKNPQNPSENAAVTGIRFVDPAAITAPPSTSMYYNNGTIPTSVLTHVYYFFNGSSINITVATCARMDNVTAVSANITNMDCYNTSGVNASGTWSYDLTASGVSAGNETDHNVTVNLTFNGYTATVTYPFVALMNFNPIYMDMALAGGTTDWRTIADFTSVSGLTFEKIVDGDSLGVLKFWGAMNLTDLETATALQSLDENMKINQTDMVINSTALLAMNVSSNLVMYNLTFSEAPAIFSGGAVSVAPGNTSGGTVTNLSYSGAEETLTFNVSHWTDYTVGGLESVSTSVPADNSTNFTLRLIAPAGKIFTIDANVAGCYVDGCATPHDVTVGSGNTVTFNVTRGTAGAVCINATNGTTVLNNTNVLFTLANWTFMVYLDGDNNLEAAGIDDFLEMSSVGSTSDVNIVVQFDRIPSYDARYGDWTDTKRFLVTSGMTPTAANATADLGEINMATPENLSDFMVWGMANYPAERYALVLWNHGSGWKYAAPLKDPFRCIIYDTTSGNDDLSMTELRYALNLTEDATGDTVDLLGFDACLMAMVEVSYQVRDYCNVTVGSEEVEPYDGWPYDTLLGNLTADSSMNATTFGSTIVSRYIEFYGTSSYKTQSAANQTELLDLVSAIDNFAYVLNDELATNRSKIESARSQCEKYSGDQEYIDLYNFTELINSSISSDTVQSAAMWVMGNVSSTIIAEAHGASRPNSHGFSIYFPVETYSSSYNGIDFAEDTFWNEFLVNFSEDYSGQLYVNATGWWREGSFTFNVNGTPIQAAVDDAAAGETIVVYNGSYTENVNIGKRLTLQGEGADVVNVRAYSTSDHVFEVTLDYVNITGFTVMNATNTTIHAAGIWLHGVEHCNISYNNATGNCVGIVLYGSSNNTLKNNTANDNSDCGIVVDLSNYNNLTNNTASDNNVFGIYLESSNNNALKNNTANSNSECGITLDYSSDYNNLTNNTASDNDIGIVLNSSINNTLTSNTANANIQMGILLEDSSNNNTLTSNTANSNNDNGILLDESSNNKLQDNTVSGNVNHNIYLNSSNNNTLTDNTASDSQGGIYLNGSSNNTLTDNIASNNTHNGILLEYSSNNNNLTSNNASNNSDTGICLTSSSNNTLSSNTASDNSDWDILIDDSPSNTFTDNTLNGTTVSFTYSGNVSLKGEGSPAANPSGWHNISKFISATNQSVGAWLYLNFSYSDSDLTGTMVESSLTVWKHNGTAWVKDGWDNGRHLDTTGDVVGVNITTFSVFAPMGVPPLHHINVTPTSKTLGINESQDFIARGYGQDGVEIPDYFVFEWGISDAYLGNLTGLNDTATNFTAEHVGITYITASNGSVTSGQVQVTVNGAANNTNVTNETVFTATSGDATVTGSFSNNLTGWINTTAIGNATNSSEVNSSNPRYGLGSGDKVVSGVTINVSGDSNILSELAAGNGTIRIRICYNVTTLTALGIDASTLAIWKYDNDTKKWVQQSSTRSGICVYADVDHLCTFGLVGSKATGGGSTGGGGTYPPGWFGTPTPTVTATKAPANATAVPPGERVTPAATKKPAAAKAAAPAVEGTTAETAKKGAPGFTAVFAIAGMLAVAYAMMRRRE